MGFMAKTEKNRITGWDKLLKECRLLKTTDKTLITLVDKLDTAKDDEAKKTVVKNFDTMLCNALTNYVKDGTDYINKTYKKCENDHKQTDYAKAHKSFGALIQECDKLSKKLGGSNTELKQKIISMRALAKEKLDLVDDVLCQP